MSLNLLQRITDSYLLPLFCFGLLPLSLLLAVEVEGSVPRNEKDKEKVVIAHRAASGYLPEHSLPALAMAHAFGVDYLESDIVLTKDDVAIVLHDIFLDTTTNVATVFPSRHRKDGRWYAIDFTLKEIQTFSMHERVNLATKQPVYVTRYPLNKVRFQVAAFSEWIALVQGLNRSRQMDIGIYPEIKSPKFHQSEGKDISKIVLKVLAQYGYKNRTSNIYLQCFNASELKRIKSKLASKLKLVQLIGENSDKASTTNYKAMRTESGIQAIAEYADAIGPWINHILIDNGAGKAPTQSDLVKWAHQHGLKVHPYTFRADLLPNYVNSFDELQEKFFFDVGVDGIFTDFADKSIHFLRNRAKFSN